MREGCWESERFERENYWVCPVCGWVGSFIGTVLVDIKTGPGASLAGGKLVCPECGHDSLQWQVTGLGMVGVWDERVAS